MIYDFCLEDRCINMFACEVLVPGCLALGLRRAALDQVVQHGEFYRVIGVHLHVKLGVEENGPQAQNELYDNGFL